MTNYYYNDNELYHYGVKGMKWGVRKKYYTKDGKLNTSGRIKQAKDTYSSNKQANIERRKAARSKAKAAYQSSGKTRADRSAYRKAKYNANANYANQKQKNKAQYKKDVDNSYNKNLVKVSAKSARTAGNKQLQKISNRMDNGDGALKAIVKQSAVNTGRNMAAAALAYGSVLAYNKVATRINRDRMNRHVLRLGQQKLKKIDKNLYRIYHG